MLLYKKPIISTGDATENFQHLRTAETLPASEEDLTSSVIGICFYRLTGFNLQAIKIQSRYRGHMDRKRLNLQSIGSPNLETQILHEDVLIDGLDY